jgi:hypothetical protein
MQWSDIPFRPSTRILRQFAGLWILFFGGLAGWHAGVRGNLRLAAALAALAVVVGGVGLIRPQTVRWIYVGWMILVFPIGWTVSRLLLAGLYYGLITPIGLVQRLMGRDALQLRFRERQTYWMDKPSPTDPRSYFRQF